MASANKKEGSVALFGSAGQIGRALLPRLATNPRWKKIICFDMLGPKRSFAHSKFYKVDMTEPTLSLSLLEIFEKEKVDTVVHTAFADAPAADPVYLHDYECIGTLQILAACAQAGVRKLVVQGTTMVYGAGPANPIYLSEEQPLKADPSYYYLREKVDVENQVDQFRQKHPEIKTTLFRFATLAGCGADNFLYRYFKNPVVPTVIGFDPLWQVLHIEDALDAFEIALEGNCPGVYNYAAPGVLPLSTVIRLLGNTSLPLPHWLLKAQVAALRLGQLVSFPPQQLAYFKFGCLADCTRAFKVMGLRPRYNIQQALESCEEEQGILSSAVKEN